MKRMFFSLVLIILVAIVSYNVGAATTIPATGVSYGGTTVAATLDSLITKANAGDATAAQILTGKKALVQGKTLTGTMPNNGIGTEAGSVVVFNSNLYYRIPVGYYAVNSDHGQSEVRAPFSTVASTVGLTANKLAKGHTILGITGTYTSDATATAADIASGKTAYVNGTKLTGTATSGQVGIVFTSSPVDMTQYTSRWAELTTADFKAGAAKVYGYVWANEKGNGSTSFTSTQSFKYDNTTGKLSWSNVTKSSCISDGYLCVEASARNSFVVWLGTVGGV